MEQTQPVSPTPAPKTSYSTLIGLVVVVVAIALAALYFLNERVAKDPLVGDAEVEALTAQGTSTDEAMIEEDLDAQSPDDFDQDLDSAFVELEAAFEE